MKRIVVFDYLRAVSAFLVMWGHIIVYHPSSQAFLGKIANDFPVLDIGTQYKLVFGPFMNVGEFAVAIFFLLSGFLVVRSRGTKTIGVFLLGRLIRLVPLVFASTVFCVITLLTVNSIYFDTPFLINASLFVSILTNSLLINDVVNPHLSSNVFGTNVLIPTYWFLQVLVKFYLLIALIKIMTQKRVLICSLSLVGLSLFQSVFHQYITGELNYYLTVFSFSGHHIIFILLGVSLYLVFGGRVLRGEALKVNTAMLAPLVCFLLFVISFMALSKIPNYPLPKDMIWNYSLGLCVFIISVLLSHRITSSCRIIQFLSNISFSLYVVHFSIGAVLVFILGRLKIFSEHVFLLYACVFSGTIFIAWVFSAFIEKKSARIKINYSK